MATRAESGAHIIGSCPARICVFMSRLVLASVLPLTRRAMIGGSVFVRWTVTVAWRPSWNMSSSSHGHLVPQRLAGGRRA